MSVAIAKSSHPEKTYVNEVPTPPARCRNKWLINNITFNMKIQPRKSEWLCEMVVTVCYLLVDTPTLAIWVIL